MVFLYMHSHLQMSQARIQSRSVTAFKVERGIGTVGSGVSVCHFIFALQILFWIKSKPKRDVFSNYEMDVVKITPEQLVSLKWVTDGRNLAIAILQNLVEKIVRSALSIPWVHSCRCGENNFWSLISENFYFVTPVIFFVCELNMIFWFRLAPRL